MTHGAHGAETTRLSGEQRVIGNRTASAGTGGGAVHGTDIDGTQNTTTNLGASLVGHIMETEIATYLFAAPVAVTMENAPVLTDASVTVQLQGHTVEQ